MLEEAFFNLIPLKYPKLAPKFEKNSEIGQKMKKLTLRGCNFFVNWDNFKIPKLCEQLCPGHGKYQ